MSIDNFHGSHNFHFLRPPKHGVLQEGNPICKGVGLISPCTATHSGNPIVDEGLLLLLRAKTRRRKEEDRRSMEHTIHISILSALVLDIALASYSLTRA
jgi:hypothetical protein